jgi:hypothetical protein
MEIVEQKKQTEKEYNKEYYAQNKARISAMLCEKEECTLCGKQVNHQGIKRHQKSPSCQTRRAARKTKKAVRFDNDGKEDNKFIPLNHIVQLYEVTLIKHDDGLLSRDDYIEQMQEINQLMTTVLKGMITMNDDDEDD